MNHKDAATQPEAFKQALSAVKEELGLTVLEGLTTIERREYSSGRVCYRVCYQEAESAKRVFMKDSLELTEEEFLAYEQWWMQVLASLRDQATEAATEKLRGAGFYLTDSAGLRAALKILEIIQMSYGSKIAGEILRKEIEIYLSPSSYRGMDSSIILAGPDGKMKVTARRALAALHTAGLIKKDGNTSSTRYYV